MSRRENAIARGGPNTLVMLMNRGLKDVDDNIKVSRDEVAGEMLGSIK